MSGVLTIHSLPDGNATTRLRAHHGEIDSTPSPPTRSFPIKSP